MADVHRGKLHMLLHDTFVFFLRPDTTPLRRFLTEAPRGQGSFAALEKQLWDLACGVASNRRRSAFHRFSSSGSSFGRPARMGKAVRGRKTVAL